MDKMNKDWELLKFPLNNEDGLIVNANNEQVAKIIGSSDTAENNFVGNYLAESVNIRQSNEERIAELESFLKEFTDYTRNVEDIRFEFGTLIDFGVKASELLTRSVLNKGEEK